MSHLDATVHGANDPNEVASRLSQSTLASRRSKYRRGVTPIFQTSTYAQNRVGEHLVMTTAGPATQPNGARNVSCSARGRFARHRIRERYGGEDALLRQLRPGDHLLIPNDAYAVPTVWCRKCTPSGIDFSVVATHDLDSIEAAIRPETRIIWVETPTNPLLQITDISAVADLAHRHHALLALTTLSPRPIYNDRSLSAPTSWCTRRRSIWAAIAM